MPWRCPACGTKVQHATELPRSDRVYRCPVCRLQMTFNAVLEKMQPLPPNNESGEDGRGVA
jgi:DNA-directed RNA polymerase subunit RPC12/RpoP